MTVLRKIVALTALLAGAVLLFAVVCPVAPTPTAVLTSRSAPITTIAFAVAATLPSLVLLISVFFQVQLTADSREVPAPLTVLGRTCVILC